MAGSGSGTAAAGRDRVDLRDRAEEIARAAGLAPSLHNAQPWAFRVRSDAVDVYADLTRRVPVADPDDRQLFLGVGAAVFGVRLALAHLGLDTVVRLAREPERPDLAAVVGAAGATGSGIGATEDVRLYRYLEQRRTVRTPFTNDAVPVPLQVRLAQVARAEWVAPHWLVRRDERRTLAALVRIAEDRRSCDPAFRAELERWTRPATAHDGAWIPPANVRGAAGTAGGDASFALREFPGGTDDRAEPEAYPGILVLGTPTDRRADWLRAGQALHRVLLVAASAGFAASYLNQPLELPALRRRVHDELRLRDHPQLVLRVGRPAGAPPPPTPRRPVEDVLVRAESS